MSLDQSAPREEPRAAARPRRGPFTVLKTDFHRGWGGQIDYVLTECRGLLARGHDVTLAVPAAGKAAARAREAGIPLYDVVRFRKAKYVHDLWRDVLALRRFYLAAEGPLIVHSQGSQDTWAAAVAGALVPAAKRPMHVLTRHNTKRVRHSAANRWLFGRLDQLIVVAREVIERYRPFIEAGILDDDIPVIHAPLRPDFVELVKTGPPGRHELREELGVGEEVRLVGTAARLVPDKGQKHLVEALAILRGGGAGTTAGAERGAGAARPEDLRVVLAGDGPDEPMLRELAATLGVADAVHFLGFRTDVARVLAALDVAVLPSVDCDASSGMIKESLSLGVPVVATEIGGARELLGGERYGRVVPAGDGSALAAGIAATLDELEAARARAAEGGRHVVETYTIDAMLDAVEQTYEKLLKVEP